MSKRYTYIHTYTAHLMKTELYPDRTDIQTFREAIIQLILVTTPFNTPITWLRVRFTLRCDSRQWPILAVLWLVGIQFIKSVKQVNESGNIAKVIFLFAPCINSIKALFIIPTDAHNYKIIWMLKTIKIPTVSPTCFGSRRNHHQRAISCLAKTTVMILLCSSLMTWSMLWRHTSLLYKRAVHGGGRHWIWITRC